MSLPVYFVSPERMAGTKGRFAACGWHCTPDGALAAPAQHASADALVFDDRVPLPSEPDGLIAPILDEAKRLGAAAIVLDFERPPSPAARALAQALAEDFPTAAPEACCAGRCTPIACYCPSRQTFPEFLARARGWIELRPIRETVRYPLEPPAEIRAGQAYFSELLQCSYRAEQRADGLVLELFDTPESFRGRFALIKDRFIAAIGVRRELEAFGLGDS